MTIPFNMYKKYRIHLCYMILMYTLLIQSVQLNATESIQVFGAFNFNYQN